MRLSRSTCSAKRRCARWACSRQARQVTFSGCGEVIAYGTSIPQPVVTTLGASGAALRVLVIKFRYAAPARSTVRSTWICGSPMLGHAPDLLEPHAHKSKAAVCIWCAAYRVHPRDKGCREAENGGVLAPGR